MIPINHTRLLSFLASLLLLGCSESEEMARQEVSRHFLPMPVVCVQADDSREVATRVAYDGVHTTLSSKDELGLFVFNSTGVLVYNHKYTYATDQSGLESGSTRWTTSEENTVVMNAISEMQPDQYTYVVYYPYREYYSTFVTSLDALKQVWTNEVYTPNQTLKRLYTQCDLLASETSSRQPLHTLKIKLDHQFASFRYNITYSWNGHGGVSGLPGDRECLWVGWYDKKDHTYTMQLHPYEGERGVYDVILPVGNGRIEWYYYRDYVDHSSDANDDGLAASGRVSVNTTKSEPNSRYWHDDQNEGMGNDHVGQFLFSDGVVTTLDGYSGSGYPVGVVFSNITSASDCARGLSHGYVLSLKDIPMVGSSTTYNMHWSEVLHDEDGLTNYGSAYLTNWQAYNLDGLNENVVIEYRDDADKFPPFYAARSYNSQLPMWNVSFTLNGASIGVNTNRQWYIPSNGQWWLVMKNLGLQSPTDSHVNLEYGSGLIVGQDATHVNHSLSNINAYIQAAIDRYGSSVGELLYDYNNAYGNGYWCSSEFDANSAFAILMRGTGETMLSAFDKRNARRQFRARPVLAF